MKIIFSDISLERQYKTLLPTISGEVSTGNCLQICGANGSGKTTMLRILAGFIRPTQGTILCDNRCIATEHDDYQQQLHYLGHLNGIKNFLSVLENLQWFGSLMNMAFDETYYKNILEKLNLSKKINAISHQLSSGQKRRLAFARLLLAKRPLWILDEPYNTLDTAGKKILDNELHQHLVSGGSAIIATHQNITHIQNIKTLWLS